MDSEIAKGYAGWIGIVSSILLGSRSLIRFVRTYRTMQNPHLTVRNGTLDELMREVRQTRNAVGRIESRQDRQTLATEALADRVSVIENRLSI